MEVMEGESSALAIILHSTEDDDKRLSSEAVESLENLDGPQLCQGVILELSKYLDVESIKSARLVSTTWNKALETQCRKTMMLIAGFNFELSIRDFVKVFNSDAMIATTNSNLIASSIWIQKSKFLNHQLMTSWLETYGKQLTTIHLGNSIYDTAADWNYKKKYFTIQSIEPILTRFCPNLKVFKIFAPFINEDATDKALEDIKDVNVALDHLEIGHEYNGQPGFYFTSRFLLNILKCIESVKSVKLVAVKKMNLHGIMHGFQEATSVGDDYAKEVFQSIKQLNLLCGNIHPRRLFHLKCLDSLFNYLQKLEIGCFCTCGGGSPMDYLPTLLSSYEYQLKELVFYQCHLDFDDLEVERFACPNLNNCFFSTMTQLEIFKMLLITKWDDASLDFLEKLPALKQLEITLDERCEDKKYSLPKVEQMFNVRKSQRLLPHLNLEKLTFCCFTKSSKCFYNIQFCFPNLKKLEVDFCGTPVFYAFRTFKKLKDLTLHLFEPFECLDSDDFEELSGSGIEKLCLERYGSEIPISLNSIVDGCLSAGSLRELRLKGMKISRKEYVLTIEKLKTTKLQLWINDCEILE